MDENKKKLTKAEMEKAKGGIGSMTDSPHCLKCGCITEFIGGAYRCCSPTCVEVGRPKGKDDVDWY